MARKAGCILPAWREQGCPRARGGPAKMGVLRVAESVTLLETELPSQNSVLRLLLALAFAQTIGSTGRLPVLGMCVPAGWGL